MSNLSLQLGQSHNTSPLTISGRLDVHEVGQTWSGLQGCHQAVESLLCACSQGDDARAAGRRLPATGYLQAQPGSS